jgi:hypothetical protein
MFLIVVCTIITACGSNKSKVKRIMEQMESAQIVIPYDKLDCWASDSIIEVSPWNKARLKLVHYVDSATCSTCYLHKVAIDETLFNIEALSNNDFYNVFIISPDSKAKKKLEADYFGKLIPQTIFVDSISVFMKLNPNIPPESMFHTFLLDEDNKVILVGNPMLNKQIETMMLSIVEEKLGINLNKEKDLMNNE